MSSQQRLLRSLSSGVLCCASSANCTEAAVEYTDGPPGIWTHHFASKPLWEAMQQRVLRSMWRRTQRRRFFSPNPWPLRIANAVALAAIAALLSYGAYHAMWVAATLRHL